LSQTFLLLEADRVTKDVPTQDLKEAKACLDA